MKLGDIRAKLRESMEAGMAAPNTESVDTEARRLFRDALAEEIERQPRRAEQKPNADLKR